MGHLLLAALRFLRRNLLLFAFIVLGLLAAPWIAREWGRMQRIVAERPALQAALADVDRTQGALAQAMTQRVAGMAGAPVRALDAEIRALDAEIAALERQKAQLGSLAGALLNAESMAARLRDAALLDLRIALRRQARAYLGNVRAQAVVLLDRQAALATLEQRRLAHMAAYAAYGQAQRDLLRADAGWLARLPGTPSHARQKQLEQKRAALLAANNRAHAQYVAQRALLARLPAAGAAGAFHIDAGRLAAGAALRERLAQAEHLAAQSRLWQAYLAVRPVLPAALAVLLASWLLPAALRTLFYFVLAPLAARRPPIVIRPGAAGTPASARISAVSQTLTLAPGHELLVRPDFCQSQPAGIAVGTALLFDWRRPATSIAAHLWMLTRLRATREAAIVVSSTSDALDEVAVVVLAAGEALVLQPRALVGMAYRTGARPAIRSHWRHGTLHAWLTLQLRYLVFEGPATLIVKGCRGVRLESAAAGRTVSQEMTLGFSANARYATVRAEPFLPYLRGVQPLLHDKFVGGDAYFLYEEVARSAQPGRGRQHRLERLFEAGLKAFGI